MPPMEFGLLYGLSQPFSWNEQIQDLRYQQQLDKQANIAAANKAKMFADDFQYNNAMNTFDNPRVKAFSQAKIKEIGQFVNQNPDWETNMQKRQQYSQMVRELKDNPELNRGLASDEGKKAYLKDLAEKNKNPETFNKEGFDEISKQWQNYERYGNQYATSELEAQRLGLKEFVYTQPQDRIFYEKRGREIGSALATTPRKLSDGSVASFVTPEAIDFAANNLYSEDKKQADREAVKAGFIKQDGTPDGIGYIKATITPYAKSTLTEGDRARSGGYGGIGAERKQIPVTVSHTDEGSNVAYTSPESKAVEISVTDTKGNKINGVSPTAKYDKNGNLIGGTVINLTAQRRNDEIEKNYQSTIDAINKQIIEYQLLADEQIKQISETGEVEGIKMTQDELRQQYSDKIETLKKSLSLFKKQQENRKEKVITDLSVEETRKAIIGATGENPDDILVGKQSPIINRQEQDLRSKQQQKAIPQISEEDRQALDWANNNPNDVRAQKIKERLKAKGIQ